uniref:Uncharacterized protein n=1 Tax=Tanacetum cinerariifolium TaxID=118510 RepID=A0A6L2JGE0_TANCI|nr:hypothetical protein [Tanacetum cinerariifolium]
MKSWLVQKQTALGKDTSNPLMADNLPKIVWYSTHHVTLMKKLASPKANSSCDSPLLGVNTPRSDEDRFKIMELTVFVLPKTNDVTRLQALVDKKKVVTTEATIRDALRLDDAEGVDCLPNEEIFAELARMGYEKLSTTLTFYKAFFSSEWKVIEEEGDAEEQVQDVAADTVAQGADTVVIGDVVQDQSILSPTPPTPPPQQPQDLPSTSQEQHTSPQSP